MPVDKILLTVLIFVCHKLIITVKINAVWVCACVCVRVRVRARAHVLVWHELLAERGTEEIFCKIWL